VTLLIDLFGGFRVTVDGGVVAPQAWSQRKPAALVKLLALAPGHRLRREQAMDALWPELDPQAAAANLRKALHSARRSLGGGDGSGLILSAGDLICLPLDGLTVDVDDYWSLVRAARRTGNTGTYSRAVDVYKDGLLPEDRYEDWAAGPREELQADWLALVEEYAGLLEARAELNSAARAVQRLVAADPLREENHAWLMRLYALGGRRDEARRQYARLREALAAELGVEPGPETQRQFAEIGSDQTAEPELTSDLWERVGDLRVQSGDPAGAVKAFGQALTTSSAQQVTGRIHRKRAGAWLMQHMADEAEPHVEIAESLSPDTAERGRLACLRANLAWERGDLVAARSLAERAHEIASAEGDADDVAAALEALAFIAHVQGAWRPGLQAQIEGLAEVALGLRVARFCDFNHCLGQYQLYGDGLADDVEGYARETLAVAERADAVPAQAFAWCLLGESLLLRARWDEAAACLERSCELYAPLGSRSVALPWLRRAELAACTGAHDEAAAYLKRASAIATVTPMARHAWARLHATAALAAMERGEPELVIRSVRATQSAAARYGDCQTCSALLNPVGAQAFALNGDRDGAHALAEVAAQHAASFGSSAWSAMAESAAASAAFADGDLPTARQRFGAAAALYEKAGHTFWASRASAQLDAVSAAT
jgi:DNA-binding SARP family transcriptional activator